MFSDDEMTSWKLALKPSIGPSALLVFNWFNFFVFELVCLSIAYLALKPATCENKSKG